MFFRKELFSHDSNAVILAESKVLRYVHQQHSIVINAAINIAVYLANKRF